MLNWEDGKIITFKVTIFQNGTLIMMEPVVRIREFQPATTEEAHRMIEDALIILCRDGILNESFKQLVGVDGTSHDVQLTVHLAYNEEGRRDWYLV